MPSFKTLFYHLITELKSYLKVCVVGLVGMGIQLVSFNILRHFLLPQYANAIGTELAIISNFLLNNIYSFKHQKISRSSHGYRGIFKKAVHFNLVSLLSLLIQFIVVTLGTHFFGRGIFLENGFVLLGIILGSLVNYYTYSRLIWKRNKVL